MMSFAPPAIVFINNDLTPNTLSFLQTQLKINYTYDGYLFDSIMTNFPDFPSIVKANDDRILVISQPNTSPFQYVADIVLFYKAGLVSLSKCNAPNITFPLRDLHLGQLGIHQKTYVNNFSCFPKKCLKSYELLQSPCNTCGSCKSKCNACSQCSCLALKPIYKRV